MKRLRATYVFSVLMAIGSGGIFLPSCKPGPQEGMIIVTRAKLIPETNKSDTSVNPKYIPGAQIVEINSYSKNGNVKILTGRYFSARSPQVSFDGKSMLFTAQKNQKDPWQIWEMDLKSHESKQITGSDYNCTDPVYLPAGRILFSRLLKNDSLRSQHSLFTCKPDGSDLRRITFGPYNYLSTVILKDGRILTLGQQVFPVKTSPMLMVLRPDGTKADVFYRETREFLITGKALETSDGNIVFPELKGGKYSGLVSISYNRPLHSFNNITSEGDGDFQSTASEGNGKLIVTYRKSESDRYGLFEFDTVNKRIGKVIYNDPEYDVLEAVPGGAHERPKKLPSEVDMGVKTGLLLCQNINLTGSDPQITPAKLHRIRIMGIDSALGSVDVEADGSVYLKVMADKPFRVETIENDGKKPVSSSGWIWLRPNERRGCVGCHQDPELAPSNFVPMAVKKSPVVIPVHINKVVEKKVLLE